MIQLEWILAGAFVGTLIGVGYYSFRIRSAVRAVDAYLDCAELFDVIGDWDGQCLVMDRLHEKLGSDAWMRRVIGIRGEEL